MRALRIAATGMEAQQTRVEVISNNIANMSTNGYQARRAEFSDLHYQTITAAGSISSTTGTMLPTGVQLGLGVELSAVHMEMQQGALLVTDEPLDVGIQGDGWFTVQLPSGETAYTRDGAFSLDADRQLVTSDGFAVGDGLTIPSDAETISISANGDVTVTVAGEPDPVVVGSIETATFPNNKGLHALGGNLFVETAASGSPSVGVPGDEGRGTLAQGFIEASSVDVVSEITELIEAQRGYEMNSKVVTAADQMLGSTVQIR